MNVKKKEAVKNYSPGKQTGGGGGVLHPISLSNPGSSMYVGL